MKKVKIFMIGSFLLAFAAAFTTESASQTQTSVHNPPSNKAVFEQGPSSCVSKTCSNDPSQPLCSALPGNPIYQGQLNSSTCQTPETEFLRRAIEQ